MAARRKSPARGFDRGQVIRSDGASLWQPVAARPFLASDRRLATRPSLTWRAAGRASVESGAVEFHGMPRDGSFLVGTIQSMSRPPDFYRFDVDFSSRDR